MWGSGLVYLREIIMRLSFTKTFYALLTAGLLAINNVGHAAVYDFGILLTESGGHAPPNSFQSVTFSQLAETDSGEGVLNFMPSIKSKLLSDFGDEVFMGSMRFDVAQDASVEDSSDLSYWNNGNRPLNIDLTVRDVDVAYSATYVPVTPPVPEPESYAMILAGLGLIAFTARRRKNNS